MDPRSACNVWLTLSRRIRVFHYTVADSAMDGATSRIAGKGTPIAGYAYLDIGR